MPPRLRKSSSADGLSSANGGSNARRWPTASRKPVIGSSRLPGCRSANGRARALPMRSNGSMRNSSAGSRPRRCCLPPKPQPCCSGHCSPRVRSQCVKSTGGRPYTRNSLTSRLTSLPDPVSSSYRRPRHQIPTQIATAPGGAQIFLLDLDNANVISATGRQRDSGTTEFLFKNTPIHTTEAVLTWQWVKEGSIRTYVLNRNTLELTITDRAKAGWVVGPPGKLGREATFQLQCILSRRQL